VAEVATPAKPYRAINPATGELLAHHPTATDALVEDALTAAAAAYTAWSSKSLEARAEGLNRAADLFAQRVDELAQMATLEVGKPLAEARDEVQFTVDIFRYYATEGPRLAADSELQFSGGRALLQRRPIGPLLGVMPWNYPYYQVARFVAPNLMLGNTVLLKHAESCPGSALAIEQLLTEAGFPKGVFRNLFATHEQVAKIVADPRIQGVSFTGSERTGTVIGELAGRHLKKAVLELGGSDPYIVLDARDVAEAADQAWDRRMENVGQACNSNKRMIVTADIADEFVARLVQRAGDLVAGDPMLDRSGTYAPMASRAAAEALAEQVADAVARGARLHVGGTVHGPGAYFAPAVLTGVTPGMRAFHEELFGPVAVVYSVPSDDQAVALANDSTYGLGGAVFCTDADRAARVAARLNVGMASVNAPAAESADLPFGGVKRSGFGRELGPLGMDEFANRRLYYQAPDHDHDHDHQPARARSHLRGQRRAVD
jgi:succinate-semialdehyde dehydrogenase / glutarate-semialdehyde dehydrogenase